MTAEIGHFALVLALAAAIVQFAFPLYGAEKGDRGLMAMAPSMAPFLVELLDDNYSAVRHTAIRSLRTLPGFADLAYDYVGSEESRSHTMCAFGSDRLSCPSAISAGS